MHFIHNLILSNIFPVTLNYYICFQCERPTKNVKHISHILIRRVYDTGTFYFKKSPCNIDQDNFEIQFVKLCTISLQYITLNQKSQISNPYKTTTELYNILMCPANHSPMGNSNAKKVTISLFNSHIPTRCHIFSYIFCSLAILH